MELCCVQLITIAAELMEQCCVQLIIIAATLVELCAVDCPKIDAGWSCKMHYKREDCGKNGYVRDPMYCPILCGVCPGELYTVSCSVECVPVKCVYCRTHYGMCHGELFLLLHSLWVVCRDVCTVPFLALCSGDLCVLSSHLCTVFRCVYCPVLCAPTW